MKKFRDKWKSARATIRLGYLAATMNKRLPDGVVVREYSEPLVMRSYEAGQGTKFPLLVLHGLTRQGYNDHRLVNFSNVLAASGFKVYTPNLEELQNLNFDYKDVDRISEAINVAGNNGNRPIGIMGFSFGGTYGLIAASKIQARQRVKFVFAAGGYWSLDNILEHSLLSTQSDPYPKLAMAWAARDKFDLNENEEESYIDIMNAYCEKEGCFSSDEMALINKIHGHPKQAEVLRWWQEKLPELDALNLEGNDYLDLLEAEVLLLHGRKDNLVPLEETCSILEYLKKINKRFKCCLSKNPGHMDYLKGNLTGLFGLFYRLMELRG